MREEIEAMFDCYPRFAECTLQTFDDNKERKDGKLASKMENIAANYTKLEELNAK
jgi:hypothetical protein